MQKIEHSCPCCYSDGMNIFHKLENVPVNSVLNLKTFDQAVNFPRGEIALGFCESCGFISNVAFDPTLLEYSEEYESTQSYSSTYSAFARRQAEQLIERHNLHGKDLLEIGCGNGEFLTLLCELGDNRGVGFDPAYKEGRVTSDKAFQLSFVTDYYSEKYSDYKADFVYCKMTLEHIHRSGEFIKTVRQSMGDRSDTIVFFQVPDVTRIFRDCAFEDIYYEHCSYFSPGSLARLFRKSGFEVLNLESNYDSQYVMIDARPSNGSASQALPQENDFDLMKKFVDGFSENLEEKLSIWLKRINSFRNEKKRVIIWGSGSKGVAFLTALKISSEIEYAVDINPHRQGTYMAGTGHEIVSPEFLKGYRPDVVIIMNAIYKDEISQELTKLGLSPEILTL